TAVGGLGVPQSRRVSAQSGARARARWARKAPAHRPAQSTIPCMSVPPHERRRPRKRAEGARGPGPRQREPWVTPRRRPAAPARSAGISRGGTVIAAWNSVAAGFPVLLLQLAVTTAIWLAGLVIYFSLTPYRELTLLREGNMAAAVVMAGEMLALATPLAAMMAHSVNVWDILLWGIV